MARAARIAARTRLETNSLKMVLGAERAVIADILRQRGGLRRSSLEAICQLAILGAPWPDLLLHEIGRSEAARPLRIGQ